MKLGEYLKRDHELEEQYNEYKADCAEHEIQIAINHQNMAKIRINRTDLKRAFDEENAKL